MKILFYICMMQPLMLGAMEQLACPTNQPQSATIEQVTAENKLPARRKRRKKLNGEVLKKYNWMSKGIYSFKKEPKEEWSKDLPFKIELSLASLYKGEMLEAKRAEIMEFLQNPTAPQIPEVPSDLDKSPPTEMDFLLSEEFERSLFKTGTK